MKRMQTLLMAFVVCGLSVGGFLAGRVSAQQVTSGEERTPYVFPASWGTFTTVVSEGTAHLYFFEGMDGSIRTVYVTNNGNDISRIQVTQRPGTPSRGQAGSPR